MSKWTVLSNAIREVIYSNGNREITGQVLQNALLNIISNLGNFASFAGMATPSTNPGTPDGPVYYFATQAGTYTNFGALVLDGSCYVLYWNGTAWSSTKLGLPTTAEVTSAMNSLIATESTARQQADASLQSAIAAEATRAKAKEEDLGYFDRVISANSEANKTYINSVVKDFYSAYMDSTTVRLYIRRAYEKSASVFVNMVAVTDATANKTYYAYNAEYDSAEDANADSNVSGTHLFKSAADGIYMVVNFDNLTTAINGTTCTINEQCYGSRNLYLHPEIEQAVSELNNDKLLVSEYRDFENKGSIKRTVSLINGASYAIRWENTTNALAQIYLDDLSGNHIQSIKGYETATRKAKIYERIFVYRGVTGSVNVYAYIADNVITSGSYLSLSIGDSNSELYREVYQNSIEYPTDNFNSARALVKELYISGIDNDAYDYGLTCQRNFNGSANLNVLLQRTQDGITFTNCALAQVKGDGIGNELVFSKNSYVSGINFRAVIAWENIAVGTGVSNIYVNKEFAGNICNSKVLFSISKAAGGDGSSSFKKNRYIGAIVYDGWMPRAKQDFDRSNAIYKNSSLYANSGALNSLSNTNVYENGDIKIPAFLPYSFTEQQFRSQVSSILSGDGTKIEDWCYYVYARDGIFPPSQASFSNYFPTDSATIANSNSVAGLNTALPSRKPLNSYSCDVYENGSKVTITPDLGWCHNGTVEQVEAQIDMAYKYGIDYFSIHITATHHIAENGRVDETLFNYWNHFVELFMLARNRNKVKFCFNVGNLPDTKEDYDVFMGWLYNKYCGEENYLCLNGQPVILMYLTSETINQFDSTGRPRNSVLLAMSNDVIKGANGKWLYGAFSGNAVSQTYTTIPFATFRTTELAAQSGAIDSNDYGYVLYNYCIGRAMAARKNFAEGLTETVSATKQEIIDTLKDVCDLADRREQGDEAILIYAWDEFCEGGWLMPTQTEIDASGTESGFFKLEAVRAAKEYWLSK